MAAASPAPNVEVTIDEKSWNESCVEAAWKPPPYEQSRGYYVYGASKTQAEQALWKFVEEEKPDFVLNCGMCLLFLKSEMSVNGTNTDAVLPDTAFGESVDPKNQGQVSTSSFPVMIFNGVEEECQYLVNLLPPRKSLPHSSSRTAKLQTNH